MMRDDILKKRMRAGMPVPTPLFAGRVRQTLDRLPERKSFSLFRYLPAAAMAVVAVAVIGLAVMSRMNPGGAGNWFQALAGGEDMTVTADKTMAPTPPQETSSTTNATPQSTSEKQVKTSVLDDQYIYSPSDAKAAMGNNARLIDIQKSDGVVTYVVEVEPSPELDGYYEKLKPSADMTADITYLADSPLMAFILLPGSESQQINKNQLRASIESYDDKEGIYIRGITAKLKKVDDGKSYLLLIRNENPNFRPDTDFTILTVISSFGRDAPVDYYYTLPYKENQ